MKHALRRTKFAHKKIPNIIHNQRYSLITFLPVVFIAQVSQISNLFFLTIGLSQLIPSYKVSPLISNLFPWFVVFVLYMVKEALDDIKRYKRDREANSEKYNKLKDGVFITVPCSELEVGDLVLIEKNQRIPADMIVLKTSNPDGQLFIRTDQLDGETDWKLRNAIQNLQNVADYRKLANVCVEVDEPHKDIYTFFGRIGIPSFLKSEESVKDKKGQGLDEVRSSNVFIVDRTNATPTNNLPNIQTNNQNEGTVTINMEEEFDWEPLNLDNTMWMNTVLASGQAIGYVIYTGSETRAIMNTVKPRLKFGAFEDELNSYAKFLLILSISISLFFTYMRGSYTRIDIPIVRYMVIFSIIIPLSLRTGIEFARYFHAYRIHNDMKGVVVRNSNIPEELGRITYLLTDKTGTLTKNEMIMKKIHLGTVGYGQDSFYELNLKEKRVYEFIEALSVCHNVTPVSENGVINYQASSPDEIAIVKWTELMGKKLTDRKSTLIEINKEDQYEIFDIFPFTSESKRMGIIVKKISLGEEIKNPYVFYLKGADVVMKSIVKENDWLDEETENMAREGLRTLCVGKKELSEKEYKEFKAALKQAQLTLENRIEAISKVMATLERNMILLGITGVEDILQDDVVLTLEALSNAEIKVWMITGDKVETATCIAISSKLFRRNTVFHTIKEAKSKKLVLEHLLSIERGNYGAMVIDGVSISTMMLFFKERFIKAASKMRAVVCCRCSPTQKASLVNELQIYTKSRIASIGDGGNDVSMITTANVGFGIVGKEGNQASLAADYSLTCFKEVLPMLLWHGRRSYKSSAKLCHLIIHRGTVIFVMQAIFCSLFRYSPISLYQGMLQAGYVTFFTFIPLFSTVFTTDTSRENTIRFPELYRDVSAGNLLDYQNFFVWTFIAFYQGAVMMLGYLILFEKELMTLITLTFTSAVINELLTVVFVVHQFNRVVVASIVISFFLYIVSFRFIEELNLPDNKTMFILKILLINTCAMVVSVICALWKKFMAPTHITKISTNL